MKNGFVFSKFSVANFASFVLLFLFISCNDNKDDNATPNPTGTITNVVSTNNNFSLLKSAVVKAGLAETLGDAGPYTVFAPDDNAFNSSGITSSVIASIPADQLKNILLYHTLGSKVAAADVPAGPNAEVSAVNGETLYLTKNNKGVFVNGWKVTTADISASNGIIHSIEHVLTPPSGNLVETAQSNSNLTYLVAAVQRASQGNTNVLQVLSSAGPYTVFAPTNQAFIDAGFPTVASIQAADPNTLAAILTYHVLSARAFSSDLIDGQNLTTLNGATIKIGLGSQATVKGNSNTAAANISAVNIMATNGVVHVIDKVLLP
ncbi:fasciclin domain-containing protein [Solitalea sp. MAHUQ-68]|uniref:Fasciclin domain-containing protein n=1 Tax=Solitalea agri TaxID=2953739 RepID=A0A9X2JEP9_9SPHI|nr:fasciclin domain-containing protein [Solitalea agri]MCO4292616.1 fasciclin domain-containing protein [Solitalea agri]